MIIRKTYILNLLTCSLLLSIQTCNAATQSAVFAMGCFWCAQSDMDKVPGVLKTVVGYTGGSLVNPTYQDVLAGNSGHYEAIEISFDSNKLSYAQLLNEFWHNIDPLDAKGQFCDKGLQYQSVIFYSTPQQKEAAMASKEMLEKSGVGSIATLILPAKAFYPAEAYHQDYYKKNPIRYQYYRYTCGRDARLKEVWK